MNAPEHHGFQLHPQLVADSHPVCDLPLSTVRLIDDVRWPWLILVPRRPFASEVVDLAHGDQLALLVEISKVSRVLQRQYRTDKLNIAALGNLVPQLHVHIICRRKDDAAWPRPVWGVGTPEPYRPEHLHIRIRQLASSLAG
ncbi:MAG: HIT family protein [Xanthomonadales bacterium]|nr:HIT family protein [Xanthomonadales bacterium]